MPRWPRSRRLARYSLYLACSSTAQVDTLRAQVHERDKQVEALRARLHERDLEVARLLALIDLPKKV